MANIVKLNYTADEINERLGAVDILNSNNAITDFENTLNTIDFRFTPCSGVLSTGELNKTQRYYLATESIMCLPFDIIIKSDQSKYNKITVLTYDGFDGSGQTDQGHVNVTSDYTIVRGTYFRLVVKPRGTISQIMVPVENTELYQSIEIYRAGYNGFNLRDSYATMRRLGVASSMKNTPKLTALPKEIICINHRGYNTVAPENTIHAFKLSKKYGFKHVEADVHFTSDGVPVILHDTTINRTARNADGTQVSGTIDISNITYEEALAYDFGIWKSNDYAGTKIPTFVEFMQLCRNLAIHPYIELKAGVTEEQIQALLNIVKRYNMLDNVTWVSFTRDVLEYIVKRHNGARVGYLAATPNTNHMLHAKFLETGYNEVFLIIQHTNLTEDYVNQCIENGLRIEIYCPNTTEEILALNPYVSGVISDELIASKVLIDNENIDVEE